MKNYVGLAIGTAVDVAVGVALYIFNFGLDAGE
jgi:hypothetical protein